MKQELNVRYRLKMNDLEFRSKVLSKHRADAKIATDKLFSAIAVVVASMLFQTSLYFFIQGENLWLLATIGCVISFIGAFIVPVLQAKSWARDSEDEVNRTLTQLDKFGRESQTAWTYVRQEDGRACSENVWLLKPDCEAFMEDYGKSKEDYKVVEIILPDMWHRCVVEYSQGYGRLEDIPKYMGVP